MLARALGDLERAEDAVQEAFALAVERWPRDGAPRNPAAWIVTVAKNRAVDRIRRDLATPGAYDPPTSQHPLRQARRLARNLGGDITPYRYRMLGQVATLGHYKGIADVLGLRFTGFLGWFVTRSYHLYQLPLLSRKLRVVADWTVALFFRRDLAELGGLGRPRGLRDE